MPQSFRERFSVFSESFQQDLSPELEKLRELAEADGIPIIRREMQDFLRFLLHVRRPARILEIGSGIGFSSLFMNACMNNQVHIDTIEHDTEHARHARQHMISFGAENSIRLIEADAGEVIGQLTGPYDFIFLDGPKAQYSVYVEPLIDLLTSGGILAADNVLKEGEILESRYAVTRRQRTIHARMRDYLYAVTHDERLSSSIVPVGDGVCVSVKK